MPMLDWYRDSTGDDEPSLKKQKGEEKQISTSRLMDNRHSEAKPCSKVDVDILSIMSSDDDSDLEVLGVVTNRKDNGSAIHAGKAEGLPEHHQSSIKFVRDNLIKKVDLDPDVIEARRKNSEALARLRHAAEEAARLDEEPAESDLTGGSASAGEELCHTHSEPSGRVGSVDDRDDEADDRVTLKLVTKARQEQQMRIRTTDPLSKLFDKYRELAIGNGWASDISNFKFIFDGDEVEGSDTATDLDMEDGVVIDVHIL